MIIITGSTNPIKAAASQNVLVDVFPQAEFRILDVPSDVRAQPWGDSETRQGAYNRAQAVLANSPADIGVGLEGGVVETEWGLMTTAWCVVAHRRGIIGTGGGVKIMLPEPVAQSLRTGAELGAAMDALTGLTNTKQHVGAIGILTDGLLDRQRAYEVIVRLAVAPFRQPDLYGVSL
ncbi:MAG: DUF84 family protein [Anaerolineales bacterium]